MNKRIVAWCLAVMVFASCGGMLLNADVDPYKESEQVVSGVEAYEYFDKNYNPYDGFVRYDWISFLGEFQRLVYQNKYSPKYLQYCLVSSDGAAIVLRSTQWESEESSGPYYTYMTLLERYEEILPTGTDLRVCSDGDFKRVTIGDCSYLYENGSLKKIMWKEDFLFFLEFEDAYPQGSFYEELFCSETAFDAVERLMLAVKGEQSQAQRFPWLWIALPVGVVVIGCAAAVIFLRRKKKSAPAAVAELNFFRIYRAISTSEEVC